MADTDAATLPGMEIQHQAIQLLDNVAVAAAGSADSRALDASDYDHGRVVIDATGADCTVTLQCSVDGSTWHDLATYAAGAAGPQPVELLADMQLRLHAANAGAAAENVTAWVVVGS